MKFKKHVIVFLDSGTLDYGDISLHELKNMGNFKSYFQTKPAQIIARARHAEIIITNKCVLNADKINALPKLRCIAVTATGVNNIDLEAAKKRGIAVTNVAGYSTESVAQCTLSFLLALAGRLLEHNRSAHSGEWSRSPFFVLSDYPYRNVSGKTLGIVGYGTIGKRVAEMAQVFGMKIMAARIPGRKYSGMKRYPLEEVVRKGDFLTIHAPLSPLTKNLIDKGILRKMKKTAYIINMARGGIVDEKALKHALEKGWIAGAGSDVLTQEPPPKNHPLLGVKNLLLTPHVAWASLESRENLVREIVLNLKIFLNREKRNRVV